MDPLRRDRSLGELLGGQVEGDANYMAGMWQVYDWQCDAFKHIPTIARIAQTLDFPLSYNLFAMERRGIKIDNTFFAKMSKELSTELTTI